MRRQLLGLAPVLVLAACLSRYDVPGEPEMSSHFAAATDIQLAVVRGDLGAAAKPAEWLATHEPPRMPPGSEIAVAELQAAAEAVLKTCEARPGPRDMRSPVRYPTVDCRDATPWEAAMATARIAQSCGKCHGEHNPRTVAEGFLINPTSAGASVSHMGLHAWAADRMWEGLVRPSRKTWLAGARALAEAEWLPTSVLANPVAEHLTLTEDVELLDQVAHNLAAGAVRAETSKQITLAYGQLIGTCAECHARVHVEFSSASKPPVIWIPPKSGEE